MSSFDTLESSLEDSRPLEIYSFAVGLSTYRYTSAQDTLSVGANDFVPEAISRGSIAQGADERNRNLIITMPAINAFASQFIDIPPGSLATISIIRLQRNESPTFNTQALVYKGRIQSVRFPDNGISAEITCRSLEAAASQNIPRYTYMSSCNHVLYDDLCGVNSGLFTHSGVASSVVDNQMVVAGLSASGLDVVGGYATPTSANDFRLILSQSGDTIEMLLPFGTDPTAATVQVFAGCDHLLTGDCAVTFDNVAEFGGFPFVPSKNIFASGLD